MIFNEGNQLNQFTIPLFPKSDFKRANGSLHSRVEGKPQFWRGTNGTFSNID